MVKLASEVRGPDTKYRALISFSVSLFPLLTPVSSWKAMIFTNIKDSSNKRIRWQLLSISKWKRVWHVWSKRTHTNNPYCLSWSFPFVERKPICRAQEMLKLKLLCSSITPNGNLSCGALGLNNYLWSIFPFSVVQDFSTPTVYYSTVGTECHECLCVCVWGPHLETSNAISIDSSCFTHFC